MRLYRRNDDEWSFKRALSSIHPTAAYGDFDVQTTKYAISKLGITMSVDLYQER